MHENKLCKKSEKEERDGTWTRWKPLEKKVGPLRYTFYSIVNTEFCMNQGAVAGVVARGLMALYLKLEDNEVKSRYVEDWEVSGEKIVVLKGYDHKHLRFLEKEVRYMAIGSHSLHRTWARRRMIVVLTVFGCEEDLEGALEGLSLLR